MSSSFIFGVVDFKDLGVVRDQLLAQGIYVPSSQSSWHPLLQGIDVQQLLQWHF
jgi:hypothetical protein